MKASLALMGYSNQAAISSAVCWSAAAFMSSPAICSGSGCVIALVHSVTATIRPYPVPISCANSFIPCGFLVCYKGFIDLLSRIGCRITAMTCNRISQKDTVAASQNKGVVLHDIRAVNDRSDRCLKISLFIKEPK